MRIPRAASLVLAAAAVVAAACGGSPSSQTGAPPPADRVTVVFRHGRVSGFEAFFRQVIEGFEAKNPGVRVVDETMPWDSGQQHQLYAINLEGKTGAFDLMGLDIVWIAEFTRAGWLQDLTPWFAREERARFLPGTIAAATFRGGVYAVPWFTDSGLLYYRKDLLDKHGRRVPQTWGELAATTRSVLDAEGDAGLAGFVWQGKQYEGLVCGAMEYLQSNGVSVVDENGRWSMDEDRAAASLQMMADLIYKYKVSPPLVLAADEEITRHIFGDGHAVFLRNWPYAMGLFEKEGSAVKGRFGIAPLPHFEGYSSAGTLGGWFLGVNRFSKHPRETFLFAQYMTSPEVQRLVYERVGYLPTRSGLYRDPGLVAGHPALEAFERILAQAKPRPVTPYYMSLSDTFQNEFSAVLAQLKTPRRAVRDARVQVEHALRGDSGL